MKSDTPVAPPMVGRDASLDTVVLTMVDGVRVVVPASLQLITPYVLEEQQDWFEDEIRFVRRALRTGATAIDIGANHGVYSLSMAKVVGPSGQIWAFEPALAVSRLFAESICVNAFTQVVLDRRAVSARAGSASMAVGAASELNTLNLSGSRPGNTEVVALTTLDDCLAQYAWQEIDFLKIDAEGEEGRILQSGKRFFSELSPLVMYEIRDGGGLHLELVEAFAGLQYQSYRLIPGLGVLVPHDALAPTADIGLNLFACKADRARRLAAQGLLVLPHDATIDARDGRALETAAAAEWRSFLSAFPYAQRLAGLWDTTLALGHSAHVSNALALYARSRNPAAPAATRFHALRASFDLLEDSCKRPSQFLRLASVARVAADLGDRASATGALNRLCDDLRQRRNVGPAEPFLAPSARFDCVAPRGAMGSWVLAAALEEREKLSAYSSYFTGHASWDDLVAMEALGFASDEMLRRLDLIRRRFGPPAAAPARHRTRELN